jgi:hypothetical protein
MSLMPIHAIFDGAETNAMRAVLILDTPGTMSSKQCVTLQQTRYPLLLVFCGLCMTAVQFLDLQWTAVSTFAHGVGRVY